MFRLVLALFTFYFLSNPVFAFKKQRVISIHVEENYGHNDLWSKMGKTKEHSLKKLLVYLEKSKTARKVIAMAKAKAYKKGLTIEEIIRPGHNSLLDTTLVRRFNPSTPNKVSYETKSKVYLNESLSIVDGALDLIHELTHFTYREAFNPYKHSFSLGEFVRSTVEGKGGEVEAFMVECKVMYELFPKSVHNTTNCDKIVDKKNGKISKSLAIKEFYKMGHYFREFAKRLASFELSPFDFPKVRQDESLFISSAYGVPYPLAAVQEYTVIMDRVCSNDKRRLAIMEYNQSRSPASTDKANLLSMRRSYVKRCEFFSN